MRISLIAAMSENRVIGRDGGLPWHLPADLAFFKRVTLGKPIIMGRRTCQSLKGPLPGRRNIVLSRDPAFQPQGFHVVADPEAALAAAEPALEVFVCGGEAVYAAFLEQADRIYLTLVEGQVEGDARFPQLPAGHWVEMERETHPRDDRNPLARTVTVLVRRADAPPSDISV